MWLIVPTVVCTLLAIGYAVLKPSTWSAHQSLVIRDDLVGRSFKPGRFDSQESLKSAQETVLEISRKPQVIKAALEQLGPPRLMIGKKHWPSEKAIESIQGQISIAAPNGAEFGKTDVIVLRTKASTRDRSREFITIMMNEIDKAFSQVRLDRINSMSEELRQAVDAAKASFDVSAKALQEMDRKFGADLGTLRGLNLQTSGDGSLQKTIIEIRAEQRKALNEVDLQKKQREILIRALEDPGQYLVTSSELLSMQPRLEQLVAGLSTAQLELSAMSGKFTDKHTEVVSAKRGIQDIKRQILREVQAAIHGLSAQVEFGEERIEKLVAAEKEFEDRLSGLSSSRVGYERLEQEVSKKNEILSQARQDLAEVEQLGGSSADLLTRVGEPQVATRPDPPGKRAIVGAGFLGGLAIGMGLIMFLAPPYEGDDETADLLPLPNKTAPKQLEPNKITSDLGEGSESEVPIGVGTAPAGAMAETPVAAAVSKLTPILADGIVKAKQHLQKNVESVKETISSQATEIVNKARRQAEEKNGLPITPIADSLSQASPGQASGVQAESINQSKSLNQSKSSTESTRQIEQQKPVVQASGSPIADAPAVPPLASPTSEAIAANATMGQSKPMPLQPRPSQPKPAQSFPNPAKPEPAKKKVTLKPIHPKPDSAKSVPQNPAEKDRLRRSNVRPIDLTKIVADLEKHTETRRSSELKQGANETQETPKQQVGSADEVFKKATEAAGTDRAPANTIEIVPQVESNLPQIPGVPAGPEGLIRRVSANTVHINPQVANPKTVEAELQSPQEKALQPTPNSDDSNVSADEIVRQIRARQAEAAKSTPESVGQRPNENVQSKNEMTPEDQTAQNQKLDVRRRATESLERAIGSFNMPNQSGDSVQNASSDDATNAKDPANKTGDIIPNQIKKLSDSIATFCEPLKQPKNEGPSEDF